MPFSHDAPKPWCVDRIAELLDRPLRDEAPHVLDVGPGAGVWAKLIRDLDAPVLDGCDTRLDCIEAFGPYVGQFGLDTLYDRVFLGDVRTWDWGGYDYIRVAESPKPIGDGIPKWTWDLVILGDVLEHMAKPEALAVVDRALVHSPAVLVVVPLGEWPQGSEGGNPLEAHVATWDLSDFESATSSLPGLSDYVQFGTADGYIGAALLGDWP